MKQQKPILHGRDHGCGGADPLPGICDLFGGRGTGLAELLRSLHAVGLWKLDESSGTVAADSSGFGHDMTVPAGGYLAPTWAQLVGPPGTQSALAVFEPPSSDAGTRLDVTMPSALVDDFSAGVWVYQPAGTAGSSAELVGQGGGDFATTYWQLWVQGGPPATLKATLNGVAISADSSILEGVWYLIGITRQAGVTTLYQNGVAQAATTSATPASSVNTWIANCGLTHSTQHGCNRILSWAFVTDQPISAADWLTIYNTALDPTLDAGLVWSTDGAGGAFWAYPTVSVDGSRYDEILTGSNLTSTDNTDGTVTLDATGGGGFTWEDVGEAIEAGNNWLPLTTTNAAGDDVLVFDEDHSLIPTAVPF